MMVNADTISGLASEEVLKYRLLRLLPAGTFAHARPIDTPLAVSGEDVAADGDVNAHLLATRLGSIELEVDGAIALGARVYPGLNGKGSATGVGRAIGIALQAASADEDVIQVLPLLGPSPTDADVVELFDDFFFHDTTEGPFDTTGDAGAGGTTDVIDGAGGIMSVVCDGDDNDEMYLHSIVESFKFAAAKPLYFEARVAIVEGSANKAAAIIGLMDAAGADALVDTEGGPKASYSGVVFWKVSGGLTWSAEVSIGATQTPIALTGADYVSGTYYRYGILVVPTSSTLMNVYLFIDGVLVGSATGVTYTNATEMDLIVGTKSDGTAEETALVDYIRCRQAR
jgi:hypothetical protein